MTPDQIRAMLHFVNLARGALDLVAVYQSGGRPTQAQIDALRDEFAMNEALMAPLLDKK